jgi:hypothetical protein
VTLSYSSRHRKSTAFGTADPGAGTHSDAYEPTNAFASYNHQPCNATLIADAVDNNAISPAVDSPVAFIYASS